MAMAKKINKALMEFFIIFIYLTLFHSQYNDLMKKKRIVENDKAKILQTIEELDQKKNEALNVAWQKVCYFAIFARYF